MYELMVVVHILSAIAWVGGAASFTGPILGTTKGGFLARRLWAEVGPGSASLRSEADVSARDRDDGLAKGEFVGDDVVDRA